MTSQRTARIIEESACRTLYGIVENGEDHPIQVELSMICSGEPCLWLKYQNRYTAWSRRFPVLEHYTLPYWSKERERYMHQFMQDPVRGPRVEDVIPCGFLNFWEFFEKTAPCLQTCVARRRDLPRALPLTSRSVLDRDNHTRVRLELREQTEFRVPCVSLVSRAYAGNASGVPGIVRLFPPWWQQLLQILPEGWPTWDEISGEQFRDICAHLRTCKAQYLRG